MSWQTAERMPRSLFAATEAPTPEPQMRIRGRPAVLDRPAEPLGVVRVVVVGVRAVAAEVDQLVVRAGAREPLEELVLERGTGVVGGERDAHRAAAVSFVPARRRRRGRASGREVEAGRLVAGVDGRDPAAEAVADDPPGDLGDALRGEAEVLEDRRAGRHAPKWSIPMIAPSSPT